MDIVNELKTEGISHNTILIESRLYGTQKQVISEINRTGLSDYVFSIGKNGWTPQARLQSFDAGTVVIFKVPIDLLERPSSFGIDV